MGSICWLDELYPLSWANGFSDLFCLGFLLQFESLSYSLTVASLFLAINLIESQLATPTLLGKRFSLNPLILFVWLVFWGWLWGAMGMLIGGPLLVLINVVLSKVSRPQITIS
ncbi:AI-2E family transporter [Vibrio navarrensis]|uniref:AI-2E family transporter n=1 Tax=Vibrio navarrensis TaxID=29495 RepID=UPI0030B8EF72